MVLDVVIPQGNLKTFSACIACLGRIGKDLFIEADEEQLMLRALNDAKSAFSAFTFRRDAFFEDYVCGREDGSPATCRLLIKPIQHILKNLKRVLSLRIYMDEGEPAEGQGQGQQAAVVEPHLVFELNCEVGVLKRHHFQLQDCEIVHALFHRDGASCLTAQASYLTQLLEHLQGSGHEVALVAGPEHVCVRTCRTEEHLQLAATQGGSGAGAGGAGAGGAGANETPGSAALSTEMTVHASDFDGYVFVGPPRPQQDGEREPPEEVRADKLKPVGMVFSVREVRAFLAFCEGAECNPVSLYFHEGGRPVLLVYEDQGAGDGFGMPGGNDGVQSVELVLATMEPTLTADIVRAAGTTAAGAGAGAGPAAAAGGEGGGRRKAAAAGAAADRAAAASVKVEKARQEEQEGEDEAANGGEADGAGQHDEDGEGSTQGE